MKVNDFRYVVAIIAVLSLISMFGCSSTQKTGGGGMVSVVAQNVVRIAGIKAMRQADFSFLNGKKVYVKSTGFVDDYSGGFIEHLINTKAENSGAKLVHENKADVIIEVTINTAGNDRGTSRVPIITKAERTEGTVDLTIILRDANTGERMKSQKVLGESKYEQSTVLGIQGSGQYYVKEDDKFVKVEDPSSYQ